MGGDIENTSANNNSNLITETNVGDGDLSKGYQDPQVSKYIPRKR